MQLYTTFEQGFEQVHHSSLCIWINLIKLIKRFLKGTEQLNGKVFEGC